MTLLKESVKTLKNRVRPRWIKTARKMIASRIKLHTVTKQFGLQPINNNLLATIKSSDTLCILGSGASINQLNNDSLQFIKQNDSIGFNFWLLHNVVPDLYVFEPPRHAEDMSCMLKNLSLRQNDYQNTYFLLKDGERHSKAFLSNFINQLPPRIQAKTSLSWDWEIPDEDLVGFSKSLKNLHNKNLLTANWFPNVRKRASIFYLILLGIRAGYEKIVLYGIDLNNTDYFYDSLRDSLAQQGLSVPPPRPESHTHKTDDPKFGTLTISTAIDVLQQTVCNEHQRIFIASEKSKLYPLLPLFNDAIDK